MAVALAGRADPVFQGEIRNQRSSLRRLIGRLSEVAPQNRTGR